MKLWVWVILALVVGGLIGWYMGKSKKPKMNGTTTTPVV